MQPIIFCLDMNSYFASVEQQDHPEFRGRPLGVCEHLGGIIIGASVEAKRWGIKTGTPVWEAKKLYPKIILTKTSPDRYRFYIKKVKTIAQDYTSFVEQASIDEMFADLTKACNIKQPGSDGGLVPVNPFEEALNIAQTIKDRMKLEVGDWLTCSIGIAENKLLAKIGSNLKKPDGIVVISNPSRLGDRAEADQKLVISNSSQVLNFQKPDLYQRLKLTDIPGIGKRQEKNLNALGIKTLLDLKNYPKSRLVARFGINGYHLHSMGQLESTWKPAVEQDDEIKSIGHMYTLPKEYRSKEFFIPVLYKLCEMVARRMRRKNLSGNIVHFYLRDSDYQSFGHSRRLGFNINDGREIFLQSLKIFEDLNIGKIEFKLIGVTIAGLRLYQEQLSLFGQKREPKTLLQALDKINEKYGDFTVCRVPLLKAKAVFHDSVGFGRIKEA